MLVSDTAAAYEFRRGTGFSGPATFVSARGAQSACGIFATLAEEAESLCKGAKGYLGLAVQMIELRPEEERLRATALLSIYRHLTIWSTEAEAEAWNAAVRRRHGAATAKRVSYSVGLDHHIVAGMAQRRADGGPQLLPEECSLEYSARSGRRTAASPHELGLTVAFGREFRPLFSALPRPGRSSARPTTARVRRDSLRRSLTFITYR